MNDSTISKGVFLSVTLSIVSLSEVSILDFPACMLSPMLLEISSKVSVLDCIWCLVWDIKARSSAKSRSSNCSQGVYSTPHFFPFVLSLRIQSTARVKRKGESRHPCLTPVLIWIGSESCPSCDTWQLVPTYDRVILPS